MNEINDADRDEPTEGEATEKIKHDIEHTRSDLSATVEALETRLKPSEVHRVVSSELSHVEERVRETVKEQLGEAKQAVQAELSEAREAVREGLREADAVVRRGLSDARSAVKEEVSEALTKTKQALRAATLGKIEDLATDIGDKMNQTRDSLVDTVRQNPIPAVLVGTGLAWLFMSRSKKATSAVTQARSAATTAAHELKDSTTQQFHDASDAVGHALHDAGDKASSLAHRASDTAQHWASDAKEATSEAVQGARHGVESAGRSLQGSFHENPLALGAGALVLGVVVGAVLPRTAREDGLLGEARDGVLEKAGEAVHQAKESVSQLAEKAFEGVKQATQPSNDANA